MSGIVDWYNDIMYKKNDPRVSDWFLLAGPGPIIMIVICYIYFSISAGQRYMRDKKPYNLKHIMTFYNFTQILLSAYLVYEGLMAGWLYEYHFHCHPVDRSNNPTALRMTRAAYLYFLCKLIEFLDTIFFVLRKKNRQITFLHVYHHALMPICAWIGTRYYPGGHVTLVGVINSFIHIFMYTYYMLSAFGPEIQKYLSWKKYITMMQIVQFCIILVQNLMVLTNGCDFPKILTILLCVNAAFFIYLFSSFYVENYLVDTKRNNATTSNGAKMCPSAVSNGVVKNKSE